MSLQGKGFFISVLPDCEGGDPTSILAVAQAAGLSHILIKIAEGEKAFGIDTSGFDFAAAVAYKLRSAGIAVWGWHPVHGDDPMAEAAIAIARTRALGLDGYVLEVNNEFKRPGSVEKAHQFMAAVRNALTIPIALSSFRFPDYHPELPWSAFLEYCDLHMPRVTWEGAHNAGTQLCESKRQCDSLPITRPFIPTGAAHSVGGWSPTIEEINDFLNTAKALGLPAVNFFNWETCRQELGLVWAAIASFAWPVPARISMQSNPPIPPPDTFLNKYLDAFNSHKVEQICALYDLDAVQVWNDQVRSGIDSISAGFNAFFDSLPTGAIITRCQDRVEDNSHILTWKAGQLTCETTLVRKDGKIILDYTFIS